MPALGFVPAKRSIVSGMRNGRVGVIVAVVAVCGLAGLVGMGVAAASDERSTTASVAVNPAPTVMATPAATAPPSVVPDAASAVGDTASVAAPPVIVTIGDSIMAGYGLDDPDQAWPALLGASTGATVVNLGCSGGGFIAEGECGGDFASLIPSAVAASPDVVIIQSSDNDYGYDPADIEVATRQTVDELRSALPNAQIVGFSTLWDQPETVPDDILSGSASLQDAVASVGGIGLDLGQPIAGQPDLLQDDDEHPTALGQQVLADVIRSTLGDAGIAL